MPPPCPETGKCRLRYTARTSFPTMYRGHDMADRFEKFTERARTVFSLAQEEAQRLNHNYIGTEHLLLGLVREGDGIAARVLDNLGVSLSKVRSAVEFIIGRGDGRVVGDPSITPRAKKVIELAMDEARRLTSQSIGTEHLLLGLAREGEGIAAGVLESLGVGMEQVRQSVMQVVSQPSSSQQPPPSNIVCRVDIPTADYLRLRGFAKRSNRAVDEVIREAIQHWLTEQGDADQPPPPAAQKAPPPPQAGEGSL
jgi:ATP-dependent Clp protease ATP-binding subunit ClpC